MTMAEHPKPFGPDLMLGLAQHEVADGIKILGHVGNEDVLVVRRGTEYFAVTARCTHDHGPLVGGLIVGNSIRCPWHHACFDLSTGEALEAPAFDPLSCWVVECRDGKIFVRSKYDQPKLSVGRKVGRSSPDKIVIIGGGAAGFAAAERLRREGFDRSLVVVSSDESPPYDRPNLSKRTILLAMHPRIGCRCGRIASTRRRISTSSWERTSLGIPTVEDRLVQEVVRSVLERIYEPVFSQHSHGFRPGRSCHTALENIRCTWSGMKWFVDVDIVGFFDNIDHDILLGLLRKRIDDEKFINLIRRMLKAGFVEDWKHNPTYSGTPQGGVVSPLLANIYLHELDEYMGTVQAGFDKEKLRSAPPEYWRLSGRIQHRWKRIHRLRAEGHGDDPAIDADLRDIEAAHAQRDALPARDPFDPNFRQTAVLPLCR